MRLLIENRADVNIVDTLNRSALILALDGGISSRDIFFYIHRKVFICKNPIFVGFDKVAELLIQNGADANIRSLFSETALIYAAERGKSYTIQVTHTTLKIFIGKNDLYAKK